MLKSDGYSEQIRGQDVYLMALMEINRLACSAYTNTSNEWQRNVLNYESAIENLEAEVSPFLPEDYPKKIKRIKQRARDIRDKAKEKQTPVELMRVGRDLEVKLTRAVARARLKLIVKCLHDKNLLIPENYNGIEDDDEGEVIEDDNTDEAPIAEGTPIDAPSLGEESPATDP